MQKKSIIAYLIITIIALISNIFRIKAAIYYVPVALIFIPVLIDNKFSLQDYISFKKEGFKPFLIISVLVITIYPLFFFLYYSFLPKLLLDYNSLYRFLIDNRLLLEAREIVFPNGAYFRKYVIEKLPVIIVASFAEEVFFRAFIQEHSLKAYTQKSLFFISKKNMLTSVLFGLGHVVSHLNVLRFSTFFPSLLFGYFTEKSRGNILFSFLFHIVANLTAFTLFTMLQ